MSANFEAALAFNTDQCVDPWPRLDVLKRLATADHSILPSTMTLANFRMALLGNKVSIYIFA
ncbi:MAG: hypothetical protein AAFQ63_18335 [Cyanobacteria bacterium J06621_11]